MDPDLLVFLGWTSQDYSCPKLVFRPFERIKLRLGPRRNLNQSARYFEGLLREGIGSMVLSV